MRTVPATHLKNHLGAVLREAALGPVGVERHGRVVAWLVPATRPARQSTARSSAAATSFDRSTEERWLKLAASGDLRLSRWRRAGDAEIMAGLAAVLASVPGFDAARMLALAEQLHPGMSKAERLSAWLAVTPLRLDRFLPQLKQRTRR